jgi:hypothetical protein
VSAGIDILQRVIEAIGIPVKGLRIGGIRDNGIRADEAAQSGIIVTGIVVVEARGIHRGRIQPLAREFFVRGQSAPGDVAGTETVIVYSTGEGATGIGRRRGAAQVVLENVAENGVLALGSHLCDTSIAAHVIGGGGLTCGEVLFHSCTKNR